MYLLESGSSVSEAKSLTQGCFSTELPKKAAYLQDATDGAAGYLPKHERNAKMIVLGVG